MKIQYVALAAAGLASAHPRQHKHAHLHHKHFDLAQRDAAPVKVVTVPGPTVVVYTLRGKQISEAEVNAGIKNGTLVWANGAPQVAPAAVVKEKTPSPAQQRKKEKVTAAGFDLSVNAAAVAAAPPASSASAPAPTTSTAAPPAAAPDNGGDWRVATGVDTDFPDGELDCSQFPGAYGALNLDWFQLGGWIGIQNPGVVHDGGYDHIETVIASSCSGSDCCSEGMFCSYACPAGYQKTQWPALQGATAQSVGGLLCQGGKLRLTNSALSSKLCMRGTDAVKVEIKNNLGQQVSVCRTDYPGTEAETVPVNVGPGQSDELACPDKDRYYTWLNQPTSAQYYVNPAGVGVEDACKWGSNDGSNTGNWAPLNIGAGFSNGIAYISMLPNRPTTDANLDYKVTMSGGDLGQSCVYANGMYTSAVIPGGSGEKGCTISANSGTVTFVFESA